MRQVEQPSSHAGSRSVNVWATEEISYVASLFSPLFQYCKTGIAASCLILSACSSYEKAADVTSDAATDAAEDAVAPLRSRIDNLESEVSELQTTVTELRSSIADAQSEAARNRSEIQRLKSEITDLQIALGR